jgi:hypothetical protein
MQVWHGVYQQQKIGSTKTYWKNSAASISKKDDDEILFVPVFEKFPGSQK